MASRRGGIVGIARSGGVGWGSGSGGRTDWVAVVSVRRSAEGGGRWGLGWRDVGAHALGCDACGVLSRHAAICVVTGALVIAEGALAGLLGSESVPRIAGVAGEGRVSFGGVAIGGVRFGPGGGITGGLPGAGRGDEDGALWGGWTAARVRWALEGRRMGQMVVRRPRGTNVEAFRGRSRRAGRGCCWWAGRAGGGFALGG